MSTGPLVTVIVPVYNIAEYLPECLDSLLAQTLDDLEIVVVDDGSTDASSQVVAEYAAAHADLIHVHTKPNGGLSSARNYGIERARGSFIGFVDGDDTVEAEMFELLTARAAATGADVVIGGLESVNLETGERYVYGSARAADFGRSLASSTGSLIDITPSACNKLFARELFAEGGLRFPEGLRYEDIATVFRLMARARRIEVVPRVIYHYRADRTGSIMSADFEGYLDLPRAFQVLVDGLAEDSQLEPLRARLAELGALHLFVGRYADLFARGPRAVKTRFLAEAYRTLDRDFPGWRDSLAGSTVWPSSACRTVSTTPWLLGSYVALPTRVQLRLSKALGMFQPPGEAAGD